MFLALKELRHEKLRYLMLMIITGLIAWMVFLLAGLANGLNTGMRQVVDQWQLSNIVLNASANKNLNASSLSLSDLKQVKQTSNKTAVVQYAGAIKLKQQKVDVSFFGTPRKAFILPRLTEGHPVEHQNEIIISKDLVNDGARLGQFVKIGNAPYRLKIVGSYQTSTYGMTPTIYGDIDTVNAAISGQTNAENINAIVSQGTTKVTGKSLQKLSKMTFINNIPGYSAQNTTLSMMIDFLIVIVAAVIGIFMYVLTLQKKAMFGILKAQGVASKVIIKSLVAQSLIIGVLGTAIGWLLLWVTVVMLPATMPFTIDYVRFSEYSVGIIFAALLGGIFSFKTVVKVDPITAIQ